MAYKIVVLSLLIEGREEERVSENRRVHTKTIDQLAWYWDQMLAHKQQMGRRKHDTSVKHLHRKTKLKCFNLVQIALNI